LITGGWEDDAMGSGERGEADRDGNLFAILIWLSAKEAV
jgi:hypothetical protein